jgi:chromatin segregation and condensation protein Rec8/ScpA/Scc1 (kleisin family)
MIRERFKKAAEDLSSLPRLERDVFVANADAPERKVTVKLPDVTLKELLMAFHDVLRRAEMFSNLHMQREPLSVRHRMSEILSRIKTNSLFWNYCVKRLSRSCRRKNLHRFISVQRPACGWCRMTMRRLSCPIRNSKTLQ